MTYAPVETMEDLCSLDDDEILEGFRDGWKDFPCGNNRSRSYWHGWCNAQRDRNKLPYSASAARLAKAYLEFERERQNATFN